ncbi:MAG: hypothetical protein C4527_28220 [Candidatus Omnitrophota bacterium]|jgi:hypothetical protein|nr:MAG: hypothetical protein C4527_28220 [Candidatus Omnitrophota bacterium]
MMIKTVHAIFDGKVFYPNEPVELEINGLYVLNIEPVKKMKSIQTGKNGESDTAFDLSSLAVKTDITDFASEHDHYLYGISKRESND